MYTAPLNRLPCYGALEVIVTLLLLLLLLSSSSSSFQAVGPEEAKERSPKLAVQDRGIPAVCLRQLNVTENNADDVLEVDE